MRGHERAADREAREEANRLAYEKDKYYDRAVNVRDAQRDAADDEINPEDFRNPTPEQLKTLKKLEKSYCYMSAEDY